MKTEEWLNGEQMKKEFGLKSKSGDYRTLNAMVKRGTLDIKNLSKRVKLYRIKQDFNPANNNIATDLDFCF
jgi:hypothetical protein